MLFVSLLLNFTSKSVINLNFCFQQSSAHSYNPGDVRTYEVGDDAHILSHHCYTTDIKGWGKGEVTLLHYRSLHETLFRQLS